jgi:hypothetical protein
MLTILKAPSETALESHTTIATRFHLRQPATDEVMAAFSSAAVMRTPLLPSAITC